jgi:Tfp pilus assembly protein PilP
VTKSAGSHLVRSIGVFAIAAIVQGVAAAQAPETPGPTEAIQAPDAPRYNPENRRDPFISLLARGTDARTVTRPSTDVGSIATDDITVKGIVMSRGGFVAMIAAPDRRTFIVRPNDQLLDGRIKTVTAAEVVITQDVNDPLSLVKHRDVRKALRVMDQGQ